MKKIKPLVFLLIASLSAWSQSININIIPNNPHISDSVKVSVGIGYFHYIEKISDSLFISGDTINIK
ncbi:MAG: hypothetical protein JJU02_16925, partial [Cryomorphaceae bacterium]|nr:hypothetical protein [Cryomorphaceae bacterium]